MVQEIAKKLIRMGKKEEAQDLYFIPRREEYQVFMRVGDERRFVQSFPFEEMMAMISHFKFVAGMNVGEKRRSQLGSCDYPLEDVYKRQLLCQQYQAQFDRNVAGHSSGSEAHPWNSATWGH